MTSNKSPSISILIPCFNEEKTIRKCALSWIGQTHPADRIVLVNDCSTDNTLEILKEFKDKISIINLPKNTGNKSYVQEEGLKHIDTDVFIATDADTLMDENFVGRVFKAFQDEKLNAFAGYIKSIKSNWITACREIDYVIGQDLHKVAQDNIGFLFVIPGCAGAFRTEYFKSQIAFDHDTLTEDLDFTYKINKQKDKIFYDRKAIVYTQDPHKISAYANQMRRWYCGGWQNLLKHRDIAKSPARAMELSLLYFEGLVFYPIMFILPVISLKSFGFLLLYCLGLSLALGAYAAARRRRLDLFLYSPMYVLLIFINAYVFMEQFFKEIILRKKNMKWFHPERRWLE
jgi:poly-beta-1,6-N-acetyl-D-glucosamine synthase